MYLNVYLFDAKGHDRKIDLEAVETLQIAADQFLWINLTKREESAVERVAEALELKNVRIKSILNSAERPKVEIFKDFYRFFIISVRTRKSGEIKRLPIDFLVGKNFVVTVHDGEVDYFKEFTELDNGEVHLGKLSSESFVATLLDLHIVSYFRALEEVEEKVDKLDETVLETELEPAKFLGEMVRLRKKVSNLRRWFLPHRDVFYALSRPDFQQIAESESAKAFNMLSERFENAVDAIESSRDTVLSLFDLYATKSAQMMNVFIQRLTYLTLIVGALSVIAGILGMNYEINYFGHELGFWIAVGGMLLLALCLTILAKFKRWI